MKNENTNELPDVWDSPEPLNFQGIPIRDYFAAMAMQGIIADNPAVMWGNVEIPVPKIVAEFAYDVADAMLKQREQ